jgi:IclR family transcriptional regulator, acetate operon repressor
LTGVQRVRPEETPAAGTLSAARVGDVLLMFVAEPGPIGVTAIARQLGISKAVVHRILQSLVSRQLLAVDSESSSYRLGPAVAALGARALQDLDLRILAQAVMRDLQAETEETTTLSLLVGTSRVYLDQIVSQHEIRMTVELGRSFPLHAGSSGKVMLAFAPPDVRERVLRAPLGRLTTETETDPGVLSAELDQIVADGVAVSRGERERGAGSVAAPVFRFDESVTGAISVCGPITRFDEAAVDRYKPLVRVAAQRLTDLLAQGARMPEPLRTA